MKVQDNLYIYIYIYSNLGSKVAFSPAQSGQILRLIHTGEHKFRPWADNLLGKRVVPLLSQQ